MAQFYLLMKGLATLVFAVAGCFLFGMLGSMAMPGPGAIIGALIGFVAFGLIACCAMGLWKEMVPEVGDAIDVTAVVPNGLVNALADHGKFTMIVTVHKIENINAFSGFLPWQNPDLYVSVECKKNPAKRTCVNKKGVFDEQFRIQVTPDIKDITVKLFDQDIFGQDELGNVCIDIDGDIVQAGFPQEKRFKLEMGGGKGGKAAGKAGIVLSFDYTHDYPASGVAHLKNDEDLHAQYEKREERLKKSEQAWAGSYGSCEHLQTVQFSAQPGATMVATKV